MTFSANPARTARRDRPGQTSDPRRALLVVVTTALLLMACGAALTFFLARTVTDEQASRFGHALAAESAQRAAEYLVHDDLVSLNVVTASLTRLPGIVGVTVYDRHRQPLAQSGLVQATPDTITTRALILTEEAEERGSVELIISPSAASPAMSRLYYALIGWLGFSVVLLLFVARLQRDEPAAAGAPVIATREPVPVDPPTNPQEPVARPDAPPRIPEGTLLCVEVVNLPTLEQRLAPHLLAETLRWYDDVLARACMLYGGRVLQHIGEQCLVLFPVEGANEDESLFHAVCCAQLFLGVVRETTVDRKTAGRVALQFTAALHHDPSLDTEIRALITWEICTQAGIAGRLTVTDAVSDHPVVAERLIVDGNHRHLLQIESPISENESRQQDLVAFGVVRLADSYEDLISRQVSRLCAPTTA